MAIDRQTPFDKAWDSWYIHTIMARRKMRKTATISEVLRKAIADSGMSDLAIQKATGVNRQSIARFMRGETGLRLDVADRLAAYFGIEVRRTNR